MNKTARQNALRSAVTILAILAPFALMVYVFQVSTDCVDRTQIVQFCGRVVELLVGSSGFRASYFSSIHNAVGFLRPF